MAFLLQQNCRAIVQSCQRRRNAASIFVSISSTNNANGCIGSDSGIGIFNSNSSSNRFGGEVGKKNQLYHTTSTRSSDEKSNTTAGKQSNADNYDYNELKLKWMTWFSSPEYQPTYSICSQSQTLSSRISSNNNSNSNSKVSSSKSSSNKNRSKNSSSMVLQLENINLHNMTQSLISSLQHVSNNHNNTKGTNSKIGLGFQQNFDYPTTDKCNQLLSKLISSSYSNSKKQFNSSSSSSTTSSTTMISPSSKSQLGFYIFYLMNYIHSTSQQYQNQNQQRCKPNYDTFLKVLQLHSQESQINQQQQNGYNDDDQEEGEDLLLQELESNDINNTNTIHTTLWSNTPQRALYILQAMKQQEQKQQLENVLLDRIKADVIIYNQVLSTFANSNLHNKAKHCELIMQKMMHSHGETSSDNVVGTSTVGVEREAEEGIVMAAPGPESSVGYNNYNMVDISTYGHVFKACATTTLVGSTKAKATATTNSKNKDHGVLDQYQIEAGKIALRAWESFESSSLLQDLSNSNNSVINNMSISRGPQMMTYAIKSLLYVQKDNKNDYSSSENTDIHQLCIKQFNIACQLGWVNSHVLLAMDEVLPDGILNELLFAKYMNMDDDSATNISSGSNRSIRMKREETYGHLFKSIPEEWKRNVNKVNQWGY